MTDLFAFDCDGTLSVSNGKVKIEELAALVAAGNIVVIVSPSSYCMQLPFLKVITGQTRKDNLLMTKAAWKADHYYYISDNPGDDLLAKECGYIYIHPNDWKLGNFSGK